MLSRPFASPKDGLWIVILRVVNVVSLEVGNKERSDRYAQEQGRLGILTLSSLPHTRTDILSGIMRLMQDAVEVGAVCSSCPHFRANRSRLGVPHSRKHPLHYGNNRHP